MRKLATFLLLLFLFPFFNLQAQVIFEDGFEFGDLLSWNGSGDALVMTVSPFEGSYYFQGTNTYSNKMGNEPLMGDDIIIDFAMKASQDNKRVVDFVVMDAEGFSDEGSISETDALMALYNATDGGSWIDNTNWDTEVDLGDWFGVTTDEDGSVTHIHLPTNNLVGNIPPELGNLTNLQYMDLYNNQLTESIPPELGNLTNLQQMFLYNNQLTGSIPPELGNLINLQIMSLFNNQLTGSIPPELGNLTNLQYMILYENQLTGSIPPELGNLTNLQIMSLFNNQLTGSIPPELGNLINLQNMYLYENQLTGSIPFELGNLAHLEQMVLFDNQLTGSIPPEFGNLSNLKHLYLENNQLNVFPSELNSLNLELSSAYLNNFTFEDLINMPEGMVFTPQNTIHIYDTTYLLIGVEGTIQLSFDGSVEGNSYDWYSNEEYAGTSLGNSHVVNLSNLGTFYFNLEITNYSFPDFTLLVDSVVVIVENSAAVSFTGLDEAYCNVNTEFILTGSEAPFGYFTGEGVLDNGDGTAIFNPFLLGIGGPFIITYNFENEDGSISYFVGSTSIVASPAASFDYSLGGCVEDAIFIDQSTSSNGDIIDWNWNFDDLDSEGSNISDAQNPLHQFVSNKTAFNIKLVVGDELGCIDSIEQVIAPFSTSTITGQIYSSDGTDITDGYVLAYLLSEGIISTQVDSVQIADDGSFSCLEMATCVDYIFRAYANEIVYPDVMPRWHIDAYFWLDATPVSINWDDEVVDNIDISVYKVPLPPEGTAGLGGGVYYTGGKGEPVKNVDVVLEFDSPEDKGDEVVGYKSTDELGRWEFDKLGEGTFKIRVDIPGLKMDSVYTVTISAPNTNITNLDYYIDPEHGIYTAPTGLDEFDDLGFGSIGVFPNPNTGQFYLEILKSENISRLDINAIQIWDMEGRLIKDLGIEFKGDHYLSHLNLSDIEPGMYFIKVKNKEEVGVVKFVIQR